MCAGELCIRVGGKLCVQGNYASESELCLVGDEFKRAATGVDGFKWENDQGPGRTPKVCPQRGKGPGVGI